MSYKSIHVNPKSPNPTDTVRTVSSVNIRSSPINAAASASLMKTTQVKEIMRQEITAQRINIVKDPSAMPMVSRETQNSPVIDLKMMGSSPYSAAKVSRKVNSKAESKGFPTDSDGRMVLGPSAPRAIPVAFGTVFPESIDRSRVPRPPNPTLPKVFPVLDQRDFQDTDGLLLNRTANGKILGNAAHRFINATHVPYNPPEEPVGPNNPYQKLNETWTKCWDDEAGAVYYYNNQTGEATWILPDELSHV